MPAISQGIYKQTIFKKQTALGTPGAGSGGQILRRRTSQFALAKDRYENDEIVSHQQSTGSTGGVRSTTGKIDGLLSPGTYALPIQSLLRRDFTVLTAVTTTAKTDITAAVTTAPEGSFSRGAGSYFTDGFKLGMIVRWTGWTTATQNNSRNMIIIALTASLMTCRCLDGTAIGAKAAGDSVTCTAQGKMTYVPMTGHTKDYYTFEEYYPDISPVVSEIYADCVIAKGDFGLPATGNATISLDIPGLSRSVTGAQVLTTPTAETTAEVLTAVQGVVNVNGVTQAILTGLQFSVDGSIGTVGPVIGSNSNPDVSRGRVKVTGQFTALFSDKTFMDLYTAETAINIVGAMTEDTTATSHFMSFCIGRLKITADGADDGEKGIVRTYPFVAEINDLGGAAANDNQSIISLYDSRA
jgi:hypothetical protein